jgi:indole-3-glycerol phosphate synthase
MGTYLDRILAAHRERARADTRRLDAVVDAARGAPAPRAFRGALVEAAADDGVAVIAEVKRRSPSKGPLAPDLDPAEVARDYAAGGAACLSTLTDVEFFGGSPDDLAAARAASGLPVLRKDFTVSPLDVCDAKLMGADCVLLIAAALDDAELRDFHELARELGLDALVEVHDEPELERAVAVGADLVGVNQRDLVTFAVDQQRAVRMAPLMPAGVVRVAESGIRGGDDAAALAAAGYHSLLVGESLVTSGDRAAAVAALRSAVGAGRSTAAQ